MFRSFVRSRYHQANKAILSATNNQAMAAKADSLKEEMDEAHNKVEICKVRHLDENHGLNSLINVISI